MARKKFRNFTVGAILFLSLVAIVITGFGTGGGGLGDVGGGGQTTETELAKVGSTPITTDQANNQFNESFQQLRRQLPNAQITEFLSQGGFEGSVDRLIALEALRQYAEARGVTVTRQMIDNAISAAPEFQFEPSDQGRHHAIQAMRNRLKHGHANLRLKTSSLSKTTSRRRSAARLSGPLERSGSAAPAAAEEPICAANWRGRRP